jgi:site-specific recombinase XerD
MRGDARVFTIGRKEAWRACKHYLGIHPHALRHSFAVHFLKATKNIEALRRLLGHSNYGILKRYLDLTVEDLRDELKSAFE